jgi:hypothetical protein
MTDEPTFGDDEAIEACDPETITDQPTAAEIEEQIESGYLAF